MTVDLTEGMRRFIGGILARLSTDKRFRHFTDQPILERVLIIFELDIPMVVSFDLVVSALKTRLDTAAIEPEKILTMPQFTSLMESFMESLLNGDVGIESASMLTQLRLALATGRLHHGAFVMNRDLLQLHDAVCNTDR